MANVFSESPAWYSRSQHSSVRMWVTLSLLTGSRLEVQDLVTVFCYTDNKNPETDIGVQPEDKRSK